MYNATLNTTLVQYGNDFLISNDQVFLSHAFTMEYVKVILLMFLVGFVLGSGLTSFVLVFSDELKDKIQVVVKNKLRS
ncbi:hypothetical protein SAMN04488696_2816 [Methanolobus profundi]|uniref:Uncharacterized protein n=2 Tax=Methanolobus profundi TaxID=487685 RepID=A0A1I4UNW3_9EURY|nr:hypothetical protein SAMN04488696_2816 [Methanolobus profundi]